MLLVHQTGSVRIGEVIRYTLTYTPSLDRVVPAPAQLHVKVRNTSAIPLRAAYLHGPYTLYASCYPTTFDPNHQTSLHNEDGSPQFEPNLKAGGSWSAQLTVPSRIREALEDDASIQESSHRASFTWIIEVAAQVIFSTTAAVHFELYVSRDQRSLEAGFSSLASHAPAVLGHLHDHQQARRTIDGKGSAAQEKGIYSRSVRLIVDDTVSLWNKPTLPQWGGRDSDRDTNSSTDALNASRSDVPVEGDDRSDAGRAQSSPRDKADGRSKKRRKVHLVVLTHGLHSNLGADMLYLKESIDATAKQARLDARREKRAKTTGTTISHLPERGAQEASTAPLSGRQDDLKTRETIKAESGEKSNVENANDDEKEKEGLGEEEDDQEDDDEEEVIVRGFGGNACRTERGIQYLGKRLAKWVLAMTYPDQPYLPAKKSVKKRISNALTTNGSSSKATKHPHEHSSIYKGDTSKHRNCAYHITSISFIAHSLGGLTQTYAIAYIHKHSPNFFQLIQPINFVAMACPFLGLSNENPLYVKFALDFGLVGRTGQDLGLTWKSTTMLKGGWEAMIGGIGKDGQRAQKKPDPGAKPLLRILPTGHTHEVLKLFRNRTVYSNVVNDGIVPLRTSCLLFLDWSGLGRVEKARRDNGLVAGLAGWGWAELTGANASAANASRSCRTDNESDSWSQSNLSGDERHWRERDLPSSGQNRSDVPEPAQDVVEDDNAANKPQNFQSTSHKIAADGSPDPIASSQKADCDLRPGQARLSPSPSSNFLTSFWSLFRPNEAPHSNDERDRPSSQKEQVQANPHKSSKIYKRSQTIKAEGSDSVLDRPDRSNIDISRPGKVRGDSYLNDPEKVFTPPKTSILESAGDVLNPPLPDTEFLTDPSSRPRTIFHDRIYHPEDIPPPPVARPPSRLLRSSSAGSPLDIKAGGDQDSTAHHDKSRAQPQTQHIDGTGMKVEEKIARAYHHGLSWRKVLVRLEPDAHNNMIVRRMFSNAYGWPVIKHLVDTHFAHTFEARTEDVDEANTERAKPIDQAVDRDGKEVKPSSPQHLRKQRTKSENGELSDQITELRKPSKGSSHGNNAVFASDLNNNHRPTTSRASSATWDDILRDGTDDEDDNDEIIDSPLAAGHHPQQQSDGQRFDIVDHQGTQPIRQNDSQHNTAVSSSTSVVASPLNAPFIDRRAVLDDTVDQPHVNRELQEASNTALTSTSEQKNP